MQYSIYINQKVAMDWGLNLSQASVFSVIYSAATWADKFGEYWNLSKAKIINELPLLTDKVDTIYRLQKQLIKAGLIERKVIDGKDYFKVTQKGLAWNRQESSTNNDKSEHRKKIRETEINPYTLGKKSVYPRKKIRIPSEKNPYTLGKKSDVLNNQDNITNIKSNNSCAEPQADSPPPSPPDENLLSPVDPIEKPPKVNPPALESQEVIIGLITNKFNTQGETYPVTKEMFDFFSKTYDGLDMLAEFKGMQSWLYSNDRKRKTYGGMKTFINTWLSNSQNKTARRHHAPSNQHHQPARKQIPAEESLEHGRIIYEMLERQEREVSCVNVAPHDSDLPAEVDVV